MSGPLTGRRVLAILLGGFGVVVAANLALVLAATGSFPGLVVGNSYVASQEFERLRAAQDALGWQVAAGLAAGRLRIAVTGRDGRPVPGLAVRARMMRPAGGEAAEVLLAPEGGAWLSPAPLARGAWLAALVIEAPGGGRWEGTARLEAAATGR